MAGVSYQTVGRWTRGERDMPKEHAVHLLTCYKLHEAGDTTQLRELVSRRKLKDEVADTTQLGELVSVDVKKTVDDAGEVVVHVTKSYKVVNHTRLQTDNAL